MKSIVVGTSGHIDHGKTALVKALTGTDADRLEEEKRRGITIDIGFAHLELPDENGDPIRFGFIDVPGHERFIRNMLAGVGGIDVVLLVIAADESIKPQTREHFDICRLLSVPRGITVLTKSDLVDQDTLDVVRLEVEEFVRGSFLDTRQSPVVAVSSLTGAGLDQLKQELRKLSAHAPTRDSSAFPRLPIDRAFSMKGFGTVATGTLVSGTIHREAELEVSPSKEKVRVRGIQLHGEPVTEAIAGQRTAINLAGLAREKISRGMTLCPPATFEKARRLDVSLSLLKTAAKPLRHRTLVQFHCYTMELSAEIFLYGESSMAPGEDAYAQLRLTTPALLLPGDRFIIRQFSPARTIGGGIVLDNAPPRRPAKSQAVEFLDILKNGAPADALSTRVSQRGSRGISITDLVAQTGWTRDHIANLLTTVPAIIRINDFLISKTPFEQLLKLMYSSLDSFHKNHPLVAGIGKEELKSLLPPTPPAVFDRIISSALQSKTFESAGDTLRLRGRGVLMKDEEEQSKGIIETAFASAGLKVPALKDVLAGVKVDQVRSQKIVTLLLRDKILVKISDDLVFHVTALDSLRQAVATEKIKSPKMDVTRFKAMTGVSRKYAIPLLEYLDRERVTKRVGDERLIL